MIWWVKGHLYYPRCSEASPPYQVTVDYQYKEKNDSSSDSSSDKGEKVADVTDAKQ